MADTENKLSIAASGVCETPACGAPSSISQKIYDQYHNKGLPIFNKLDEMHHSSQQEHIHKGDKINEEHAQNISEQWHPDAITEAIQLVFIGIAWYVMSLNQSQKESPANLIAQIGQGISQMVGSIDSSIYYKSEQQKYGHIEQSCQIQEQQAKDYQRLIDQMVQQTESIINNITTEERLKNSGS
jgi:hypothetical protein